MVDDERDMTAAAGGAPVEHPGALPPGALIDRYEVEAVVSASDAGIRYSCRDGDGRIALLECFPAALVGRRDGGEVVPHTQASATAFEAMLEEFLQDAGNAASFRHPGVVPLHRTIRANGTVYAVMDYVPGQTLASLLAAEGPLPADRLEPLAGGLLGSLGALHGASLMHLGVEPGEIVLTDEDQPVVLASTLVRRSAGGARHAFAEARQQRRRTAFVTSPYAAIELYAKGGQIGPWSDLYGLAATLYHCVTGEEPPPALDRVLDDDLPALSGAAEYASYPQEVLAAVDAALQVQPGARPRSVDGWRIVARGTAAPARPGQVGARGGGARTGESGGGRPRWALAALGLVAVTAVISYVDTGILRDDDGVPEAPAVADAPESPAAVPAAGEAPAADAGPAVADGVQPPSAGEFAGPGDADAAAAGGDPAAGPGDDAVAPEPERVADAAPADEAGARDIGEELGAEDMAPPEPQALPAALVVETTPAGVEVWLAGERVGTTPLQLEGLRPGVRDISLRHPLYDTIDLPERSFVAGRQVQIERRLARSTGGLRITTEPPGAWVSWRGERLVEATPATLSALPAGPLDLIVGAPGYRAETVAVEIPRDGTGELEWSLERAFGTLTLDLEPADATVTVLGEDGGGYVAGMALPEGRHEVEVLHPGYVPRTTAVTVLGDSRVAIALERLRPCGLSVRGVPPAASYPDERTFGGRRRNLGSASILVAFVVQADGTVVPDSIEVDPERTALDDPRNLEAFSDAAIAAVRRYQFDFDAGACTREQRANLVIRFLAPQDTR